MSFKDALDRVQMIVNAEQQTWDLSPKDVQALTLLLERFESLNNAAKKFLFWFNRDGSPCDGFMFREAETRLRDEVIEL